MTSAIARIAARQAARAADAEKPARKHRRGPEPLPAAEKRSHTVSVRMNESELAELDAQRKAAGGQQRGEQLRMAWLGQAAAVSVPQSNQVAYMALARSASNLTQIAKHLGVWDATLRVRIETAERELRDFRVSLLQLETVDAAYAQSDERMAEAASRDDRRKRRGPFPLPSGHARREVVSVRLNVGELDELDRQRRVGEAKRGEWLRMAWEALRDDARIAAITAEAYERLERSGDNLNSLAKFLNEGGEVRGRVPLITQEVEAFIRNLRKAAIGKE